MKKPIGKILVLLVALVLVASLLPAAVLATGESSPCVGWSLTLCDRISANFYFTIADEDVANTKVNFTCDGQTVTVNASETGKKDGNYVFSIGLAAAQMTDTFGVELVTNDQQVFYKEYSVREYANYVLTSGDYTQRDKDMVVAMLNYGAAAQKYFGYNTDALAIAGYEGQVKTYTMPETVDGVGVTGSLDGIELHGRSLLFKSRTAIRFYFEVTGDVADYTFTDGNGKTYTPDKNGDYYSFDVTDINPQNLADIVTITVSKGGESMTVSYSPLQYMVRKKNSTTANLPELVQAMYDYYQGAMKYLYVDGGKVTASNSWAGQTTADNWGGVYFNLAANDAPFTAWGVRYKPTTNDAIQLIRDGVTYDVANTGWETITRASSDTEYYLEGWTLADLKPFQANDVIRINGSFYDAANRVTLTIQDSYLLVLEGGQMYLCAGEPVAVNGGVMSAYSDPSGLQSGGFYFSMTENAAGVDDWGAAGTYYKPVTASAVKLIRNGETSNIGLVGTDMITKFNATSYFYKAENWMLGDKYPLTNGDVVVLEGNFYATVNGTTYILNLGKTYAEVTDSTMLFYTVQGGTLQTHGNGGNANGGYGSLAANSLPYDGWSVEYKPLTADTIKLVRNGETINVGNPERGTLVKFDETSYYLKYESGMHESFPLQPHDYLIVDGVFVNAENGQSIRINTTYVYYNGPTVTMSATAPTLPNIYDIGTPGTNSTAADGSGRLDVSANEILLYFTADIGSAPSGAEYYPAEKAGLKLVRGENVYDIGVKQGTIWLDANGNHFLKIATWTMADSSLLPLQNTDYLIVEGTYNAFTDSIDGNAVKIPKSYVYYNGSAWVWSDKEPVTEYDIGVLETSAGGVGTGGSGETLLYFNADPNGAPTGGEYYPEEKANLKFVRGETVHEIGVPNSGTIVLYEGGNHCVKLASWTMADGLSSLLPLQENDYLIVEGVFRGHDATTAGASIKITKSYFYYDTKTSAWIWSEFEPMTVYDLDVLGNNANGLGAGYSGESLLYFSVALNGAPAGEYYPAKAENLKFVRGENVYNIGVANQGTLAMFETGDHCLKLASWNMANNKYTELIPLQETDYLIVEGLYIACTEEMGDSAVQIPRSYVYYDGYAWVWSDSEPVDSIATGPLLTHPNGRNDNGLFVDMADNDAPYGEYTPIESSNFQVIRTDGTVTDLGVYDAGTLVKENGYYFLKCFAEMWWTQETVSTEDIMVVSGLWQCKAAGYTDVYLNIAKSYIYYDGSAWVVSQTLPNIVDGGTMSAHDDGVNANGEISFTLTENSLPADDSGDVVYTANAGTVKLSRAGETYDMSGYVMKLDEGYYYMDLTESGNLPLQDQDYLIVEGNFVNEDNGYTLNISKSYIFMDGEEFVITTTEPEIGYKVTNLNLGSGGWNNTVNGGEYGGIYISHDAHDATVNSNWTVEYSPISADAIKLVRNGETFNVGAPGNGTLVALSSTDTYLKTANWTISGGKLPLVAGDTLIIDGLFKHSASGDIMNVEYTEIVVNDDLTLSFPNAVTVYNIGTLGSHGAGKADTGFYATAAASSAPYNGDWSLRYKPVSADCVKFYDASEKTTTSVANTGGEMLVKFSETEYFFESWTLGDSFGKLALDDYYIIEGRFYNEANNCYIEIEKTYASFDGKTFVFSTTEPVIPYHIYNLTNHSNGKETTGNGGTGIYITHDAHSATANADWSVEYSALSADNIKIVRGDSEPISIAYTGQGTLVAINETTSYLKLEGWTVNPDYKVLQAGDMLILEGKFQHKGGTDVIDIEYTEIIVGADGNTLTFISESEKNIDAGHMGENDHSDGNAYINWHNNGIYFTLAENIAPSNTDWSIEYTPVSASTIKLIRGGNTYDVANTGNATVVKLTDTLYYLKLETWTIQDHAPIQDGDVLVFEGGFTNASNGYTINIAKTYVTFKSKTNDQVIFSKIYQDANGGEIELPVIPADMTIGVWNGSHHGFDDATMDKLVNAGITRIIGIRPQYAGDVEALLDRAQAHGISIILDIRNTTETISFKTSLSATASKDSEYWNGSNDIGDFDLSTLNLHHPALEGLSVFDEPWVYQDDVAWIKAARTAFDALDKKDDLMFFVNLLPENSGDEKFWEEEYAFFGYKNPGTDYLDNYVNPLLTAGSITDHVSWDDYTLIRHTDVSGKVGIRPDYFHSFEDMTKTGKPMWYTMLSAGHSFEGQSYYYETPTQGELRWQMAVAMAFGTQNINHYVFGTTDPLYDCMATIDSNGTITGWNETLYGDVAQVGNEYKAWDEIFMAYDYVGTNTQGVSGMTALENGVSLSGHGISSITSSNGGVLVGVFENNGNKAFMITNAGTVDSDTTVYDGYALTMNDTTVTLTFTDCSQVAVIDQGEISVLTVTNNSVQIPVGAYEGVFVIPVA